MAQQTMRLTPHDPWIPPIDIPVPTLGYTVRLFMGLAIERFRDNVSSFDRGTDSDHRTVEFTMIIDKGRMAGVLEFLRGTWGNHDERYTLTVPPASGFFAAGPDMDDSGDFDVSIAAPYTSTAMRTDIFGYFDVKLRLLFHNLPAVTIPQQPSDVLFNDTWAFGTVTGLRDPVITPAQEYAVVRNTTMGGGASFVRGTVNEYTTRIALTATSRKMGELLNYIQRARGGDISIKTTEHFWLFGADNEEQGNITARLLTNEILLTHANRDMWRVTLPLWYKGVAA